MRGDLMQHPLRVAIVAVLACIAAPLLLPAALLLAPFICIAAVFFAFKLAWQQGVAASSATEQGATSYRLVPVSYPATAPASDGSSPPGSPEPLSRGKGASGSGLTAGEAQPAPLSKPVQQDEPELQTESAAARGPVRLPKSAQAYPSAASVKEFNSVLSASRQPAGAAAGPAAGGGAAILARLRAERAKHAAAAKAARAAPSAHIVYASQTGTAQEIANSIAAECPQHGLKAKALSFNELGFDALTKVPAPAVVVIIAASTGDGDAPDNSATFFAHMRRRHLQAGALSHVRFTCLGLGDSNYTRFMAVSRAFRTRFQDLGAETFYDFREADEVDGIEPIVDDWVAGLWSPLKQALSVSQSQPEANGVPDAASADAGVPSLPPCRVQLNWLDGKQDNSVQDVEANGHQELESVQDADGMYSAEHPFWASLTDARRLSAASSDRTVLHLELSTSGSSMRPLPGDSLGVVPQNEPELVAALLARLHWDGERTFSVSPAGQSGQEGGGDQPRLLQHIAWPTTLRQALTRHCEVASVPRKLLLRLLAEHATDASQRSALLHLSSRAGRDDYNAKIREPHLTLLHILTLYPSISLPPDPLLDLLPPLAPRLYSISSSPDAHPDSAHIAFSVVRHQGSKQSMDLSGVATGWLERSVAPLLRCAAAESAGAESQLFLPAESVSAVSQQSRQQLSRSQQNGSTQDAPSGASAAANGVHSNALTSLLQLPVFLRRGGAFKPPSTLDAPWVMIGPGTGVAPFRGFLQHRKAMIARSAEARVGPAWLYCGCRRREEDFLYGDELQAFVDDGTLTRLEVAFSREGPSKVYVQHLIAKQAKEVSSLVTATDAYVFICGDGAHMAHDVHAALLDALTLHIGMTPSEAIDHMASMAKQGRYVRDIWS